MRLETSILALAALGLTAASLADEVQKTKMKIAIVEDSGDGETRITLDSDELGFNLHDLQEGETQTISDASGKNVLVTRTADGFSLDVDGKTIEVPAIGEELDSDVTLIDHDGPHKVKIIRKQKHVE
ncbi:MAG: hypothetical protein QNJ07_01455 [Woeseiaceae bacterium]|nr:hypothetical protein [Woeseiaceae bacterium]